MPFRLIMILVMHDSEPCLVMLATLLLLCTFSSRFKSLQIYRFKSFDLQLIDL